MKITLEPMLALFNLSGGEIIVILVSLMLPVVVVVVGVVVFLLVRASGKRTNGIVAAGPAAQRPPAQATQVLRKCPKCGTFLKSDAPEGLCPACLLQRGIATEGGAPPGTPPFAPPPLAELAKLFPQLEILEVIGQGGMGAVYKARQPALDRFVALKILAPRSGGDLDFSGRFTREARALARLNHPNIVGVYDFGTVGQASPDISGSPSEKSEDKSETGRMPVLHYFIMEYVDGQNLRQIEQAGKLTPREALQIIPQICVALQFAHDEGIVHRDIKPENVLLDKKGRVKIADFGLAKILGQEADFRLTGARDVMGTPHYMAPEQVEKPQEVDHRADIYSLGVVFYEMLTGELPLGKFDPPSHKVQIDVRLDEVVLRSLANNPDRRYQRVSEVKTEVETISQTPSAAAKSGATAPIPAPSRSVATGLGIAIGVFAAVVFIAFLGLLAAVAIPNFIKGRHMAQLQREQAASANTSPAPGVMAPTNPPASAETWAPPLAPGEKPDLKKILDDAKDLMQRGQYEQSLGRFIWFYNHEPEYGDSYQNVVRNTSALSDWVELGRRYPKAKQALIEIRDSKVREFAEGRGYADLFQNIQSINRELQDDDATYALFKAVRKGDPQLARQCYPDVESLLLSKGEYQWCYDNTDDPQSRFDQAKRSFEMQMGMQKQMAESRERSLQQTAEIYRARGWTNVASPLAMDSVDAMGRSATNGFVGAVDTLIEILVGTDHLTEAEKIRDQALAVVDDSKLKSAVSDAEERIRKRKTETLESSAMSGQQTNSPYASIIIPSPAQWRPAATNIPDASRETWQPTLAPGEKPDFMKIEQEAKDLMSQGRYEESLQREIWYHNHSLSEPGQTGVRNSFALSDWVELGRRYPKAMQALIEIRNEDERKFSAGQGFFDLFMELNSINRELGTGDRTYAAFKSLAASPDEKLAQQCYPIAEGVIAAQGDYQLCMKYIGDPEGRFKSIQGDWQRSKQWEQHSDDMQRQMNERMQASRKNLATNGIAPSTFTPPTIPQPPKFADKNFIAKTRQLIEILVGAGHKVDAEKIRDEAATLIDDARIKSAVDDAEKKIGNVSAIESAPSLASFSPVVVETQPISGARDVPPGETEIRVRFSKTMEDGSWSWSTAWKNSTPEIIGAPHYLPDARTCVLKARLQPGRTYAWWLNSDNFHNFKDSAGRPAVPYLLIFQTKPGEK
jgi:serine/threonine protein kinase